MKNIFFITLFVLGISKSLYAQYSIENFRTAIQLAEQMQGEGITILNPEILCNDTLLGTYSGIGELGIDEGIVLSTNHTDQIFAGYDSLIIPRTYSPYVSYYADTVYMTKIIKDWGVPYPYGLVSHGACVFHFDFIPNNDNISLGFVFTDAFMNLSDPYTSNGFAYLGHNMPFRSSSAYAYRKSPRCDVIGILLTGNEYEDTVNLAVYEDEPDVPINLYSLIVDSAYTTVRFGPGILYYFDTFWWKPGERADNLIDNTNGSLMPYFSYNKLTRVFKASASVQACDTYHLALGIANSRPTPGTIGGATMNADFGGSAIFFDKLVSEGRNKEGCEDTTSSVLPSREAASFCTVYPNPFSSTLQLQISDGQSRSGIYRVRINDKLGRPYYEHEGSISAINRSLLTIGDGLVNGVYVLSVEDVKTQQTDYIKIVRE